MVMYYKIFDMATWRFIWLMLRYYSVAMFWKN